MVLGKQGRGYIELIITSVIWGVVYTLIKLTLTSLTSEEIAFERFLIASVFFVPMILLIREKYTLREVGILIALAITGVFLYMIFFINGENGMSAANASFIESLIPIIIIVMGVSIRIDKPTRFLVLGVVVSTIGLIILIQPHDFKTSQLESVVLVLLSAVSWAVFTLLGKGILERHNPLNVTGYVSIFGTLMLFPFAGVGSVTVLAHTPMNVIMALIFIALFGTVIGYILWFDGLKYVKPSIAGSTIYLTPFVTAFSASFIISEPMSEWTIIGGTLLLIGVAVSRIK